MRAKNSPASPASRSPSRRASRREREEAARREIRRADVIAAASAVFAEKGFHDAQISEIARSAELSLKSVYGLFEGKEEIYQEVVTGALDRMRETVRPRIDAVADPAQRLLELIDVLFLCFEENRDLLRIYARGSDGMPWRLRGAMGESVHATFHAFTQYVISLADAAREAGRLRGLDPEALARSLVGAVTTTAAQWVEAAPEEPLSRAAPAVRAIFARVICEEAS